MEEKPRELHLEVNKSNSVRLVYEKTYLSQIIISVKKFKELLGNGVIDRESILDIEQIVLIMPYNKMNRIRVENGRGYLSDNPAENNPDQTGKFTFRVKDPEKEAYSFFVKEGVRYNERSLKIQNKQGRG